MKVQLSDIGRFLQHARKMWKLHYEGDSQIVVFSFIESCCSIAMARDALLLTYLCNRVDSETSEQVIAAPFGLLQDCSNCTGVVDLQVIVKSGESHIEAEWSEGLIRCTRTSPAQDPPEYHLMPDLAWHTVDERMQRGAATESNREEKRPSHRLASSPICPLTMVIH